MGFIADIIKILVTIIKYTFKALFFIVFKSWKYIYKFAKSFYKLYDEMWYDYKQHKKSAKISHTSDREIL